jgi:hypothetical protein
MIGGIADGSYKGDFLYGRKTIFGPHAGVSKPLEAAVVSAGACITRFRFSSDIIRLALTLAFYFQDRTTVACTSMHYCSIGNYRDSVFWEV